MGEDGSRVINALLVGQIPFEVNHEGFFFRLLSAKDRGVINQKLELVKKTLKTQGAMSEEEMLVENVRRALWSDLKERQFQELPKKLEQMKKSITSTGEFYARRERRMIERLIAKAEETFGEISKDRELYTAHSIERFVETERIKLIAAYAIYTGDRRYYKSEAEVIYDELTENIIKNINEILGIFTVASIRNVARDSFWFTMYLNGGKTAEGVWGKPTIELSDEQILLLYWTRQYEAIYNDTDCPPDFVINNDEQLDKWLEQRKEKNEVEKRKGKYPVTKKANMKVGATPFDRSEVFIMADKDKAGDIYKMNDRAMRIRIGGEQKKIAEKGTLSEYDLRVKGGPKVEIISK
jgi:hypothetical protein